MNFLRFSLIALAASSLSIPAGQAQETATTDPVGFVTVGVTAGTGAAKRNTLFSLPLLETESIAGQVAGTITGVTANSISNSNAGWTAGALSNPATPYLILITSGPAEGRMFLIASSANTGGAIAGTANTATTATVSSVDSAQVDLSNLGIRANTDTYRIYACDTLSSFFGTPESSGVQGATAANSADTVVLVSNGSSKTYFYNTTANRWAQVGLGSPDASNVALIPYYGIQYGRLASTPLSFVITGSVPTMKRQVGVKNSGTSLVSQFWPVDSTLVGLGLQNMPGWRSGASAASSDRVQLSSGGSVATYWFDGTNWRQVALGTPIKDTTPVPIGTSVLISRRENEPGYTSLEQNVPYNLN